MTSIITTHRHAKPMPTLEHVFPSLGIPPPHTHLVPVLRVHIHGLYQVACHMTVTLLGCPVQHGSRIICLLMYPCSKHWQQVFDDIQTPTLCGLVHGILPVLHWETIQQTRQSKGIKMCEAILSCCYTQDKTSRQQYVVVHVLSRGGACKRTGWSSKDRTWTSCMHLHSDLYTHGTCGVRITNFIPSMCVY